MEQTARLDELGLTLEALGPWVPVSLSKIDHQGKLHHNHLSDRQNHLLRNAEQCEPSKQSEGLLLGSVLGKNDGFHWSQSPLRIDGKTRLDKEGHQLWAMRPLDESFEHVDDL